MVRLKGQRTDKQREADYPYAVDMPIPEDGMGQNLNYVAALTRAEYGEHWGHCTRDEKGNPTYWVRIGVRTVEAADRLTRTFAHLQARRAR